jgi:hypothetical protein
MLKINLSTILQHDLAFAVLSLPASGRPPNRGNRIQQLEHIHDCLTPEQDKIQTLKPQEQNRYVAAL